MKINTSAKSIDQINDVNIPDVYLVNITNHNENKSTDDDFNFSDPVSNTIINNDGDKSEYTIEINGKYQLIMNYIMMRLDHDNLSEDNRDDLDTIGDMISKTYQEMMEIIKDYHVESNQMELNLVN